MPTNLPAPAVRGSNYPVQVVFKIPVGDQMVKIVPDEVNWTLRDSRGNIVNGREDIQIPPSELSHTITLTLMGNDLGAAVEGEAIYIDPVRILIWNATYTYGGVGSLPWRDWCRFTLVDAP